MINNNSKKTAVLSHKLAVLSSYTIELLDNIKTDKLKERALLIQVLEVIGKDISDCSSVQKTTYFQDLSNKLIRIVSEQFKTEHDMLAFCLNEMLEVIQKLAPSTDLAKLWIDCIVNFKSDSESNIENHRLLDCQRKLDTMFRKSYNPDM
jgi:hypothetical protein